MSETRRRHGLMLIAVHAVLVVFALAACGGGGSPSAQQIADEALPGQLRVLESRRTTVAGGFFPGTEVTYAVIDDPDAVLTVLNPSAANLPPAVQRARGQAAELRAARDTLRANGFLLLGFRAETRDAGVEAAAWVAAELGPGAYATTRRRLDAFLTDWAATRGSAAHPGVSPTISSISLGLVGSGRASGLPEEPRPGWPTVGRLAYPPRISALTAAQTALLFSYPRADGRLWGTDVALAPILNAQERERLGTAAGAAARRWLSQAGHDLEPAPGVTWLRVEDGSMTRLRGYLVLCSPGTSNCNVPASTAVLGLTVDLPTLRFSDLTLVDVAKERDGTWPQPLEPERLD